MADTSTALHSDLHHHNIVRAKRGWLAIDPKGVNGDPAYEPASAFPTIGSAQAARTLPAVLRRSLTHDQGLEMTCHPELARRL